MEVRPIGRGRTDGQGMIEEGQGLFVGTERCGALGRAAERDPRLGRERIRLWTLGRVAEGGEIVTGQGARQFVGPERLEESRGCEVPRLCDRAARACCRRPLG